MHRHSQGDEDRMEFGQDTVGGNATRGKPATAAEGAGRPQGGPEICVDQTRIDGLPQFGCPDDGNDEDFGESSSWDTPMGIVIPTTSDNFFIKQGLLAAIQKHKFRGEPGEDSLGHLDTFDQLCATYNVKGVSLDAVRMMLFPLSLMGKAASWERNTPSEYLSNWGEVKKEFLDTFFPKQETAKLRGYIVSFKQRGHESFSQAWGRMKRYVRMCPHHGFSKESLLNIFYQGSYENNQVYLETACGGDFAGASEKEKEKVISMYAKSCGHPYDDNFGLGETGIESMENIFAEFNNNVGKIINIPSTREINYVGIDTRKRKNLEFPDDGSNTLLRTFIHESFNSPGGKVTGTNRRVNSKHPRFSEDEEPKGAPYIGGQGLYTSRDAPLIGGINKVGEKIISTNNVLDSLIEDMIKSRSENITKAETIVETLRTGIGRRTKFQGNRTSSRPPRFRRALKPLAAENPKKKTRLTGKKEFCQFIEEEEASSNEESTPNNAKETAIPQKPDQELKELHPRRLVTHTSDRDLKAIYDQAVKVLKLVEGSPEHEALERDNTEYRTCYHNLRVSKNGYERRKLNITPGPGHTATAEALTEIQAEHLGNPRGENETCEGISWGVVREMHWKRDNYFMPCIINGVFIRDCIVDITNPDSTFPFKWVKTLNIRDCFHLEDDYSPEEEPPGKIVAVSNEVSVKVGNDLSNPSFLIVSRDPRHKDHITFGYNFLKENDAIFHVKREIIDLRQTRAWNDDSVCRPYRIWKHPLFDIDNTWLNISLLRFYFEAVTDTSDLPCIVEDEKLDEIWNKINSLCLEYNAKREELAYLEKELYEDSKDILQISAKSEPSANDSPTVKGNPAEKLVRGCNIDLNSFHQCDELDVPFWARNLSFLETSRGKKNRESRGSS